MPSAVATIVAGAYSSTYTRPGGQAVSLGVLAEQGWELNCTPKGEEINATDQYGMSLIEIIYRGADWRVRAVGKEYSTNLIQAWWPWSTKANPLQTAMGIIARRGSEIAGSMTWTSTAGTPAANNPNTLTAGLCIAALNANLPILFTSRCRDVPIELVFLPYRENGAGSDVIWFTVA